MTDENTPTTDSSTEAGGAPVRRTRSRRVATSGVTTPSAAPAVQVPAQVAPPTEQRTEQRTESSADAQTPAPTTEAAAPKKASRSRRATSASRTETPVESPAEPTPTPEPVAAAPSEAPAETAPRARRSRRATSAPRTDAAEATSVEPTSAPAEPTPAPAPEQDEPAATAPRRSRSRATAAAPTEEQAQPARATRRGRGDRSRVDEPSVDGPLDVLAELGPLPQTQPRDTARMASTALLFQAPDPTNRPKRRRAVAPAGPPRHDAPLEPEEDETAVAAGLVTPVDVVEAAGLVDGEVEADQDDVEVEDQDAAQDDQDENDQDEEDGAAGARRRRRRGGRGRRGRSGQDRDQDETTADGQETDEPAPAGEDEEPVGRSRRSRRGRGAPVADVEPAESDQEDSTDDEDDEAGAGEQDEASASSRRRRRRRRGSRGEPAVDEPVAAGGRTRSRSARPAGDEVTALRGSTRLEAKRQRRREGRDAGRRRTIVTESEFLARREAVERSMIVREADGRVQIAVLEDGVLVEHFVSRSAQNGQSSMAGNVYLGRVQNVLPSMEAAFVDVGKGRNAVLYAGEVNWDAAGMEGQPRRIEQALKSGDSVLVQVTKDPIGHKGARLTSQITLAGRYLVYVPAGGMTGISRKLPENERARLKTLLKEIVPDAAGVIVRTAAEGASEDELRRDVQRLQDQWAAIEKKAKTASAPALLQGEPDMAIRVVRDIFNDDFGSLVVQGDDAWTTISDYVSVMAPDLAAKVSRWEGEGDVFTSHRIDEQLAKGMDRKVYLPSGGSLVIDRTEAMTVVDVNTGKFTGSGGTLEETVTRNNLEAAEEIVRQLRLRDIGGIIVIDFIDMVLESNRDLVLRRLVECLGRDRTKHQVAEVTSLGLVQMTRKRVGQGLVEAFSETCQHCNGRGFIVHSEPLDPRPQGEPSPADDGDAKRSPRRKKAPSSTATVSMPVLPEAREAVKATLATIAAAAAHAHEHAHDHEATSRDGDVAEDTALASSDDVELEAPPVVEDRLPDAPVAEATVAEVAEVADAHVADAEDDEVAPTDG